MLLKSSKVMVEYAGRRIMWITPCKRSAARGKMVSSVLPELRRSSTRYGVECVESLYRPELRYACTGLSIFKTFGLAFEKQSYKMHPFEFDLIF